jgi:stage V sporulation protein B
MPITAIRVAGSLLQPLISIVLPLVLVSVGYTNAQALSELGIVMGMTFPLITIPTTLIGSLSMAITPKLTILNKQNDSYSLKKQITNSITFTLFCCFLFVPIFYALGIPSCDLLFNNTSAGIYLEKFSWVVVPMGLCQITTSILNSLGKEKFVFYSYFISAISIILSILLLPKYIGISALLVGLALQNTIVFIINFIKINQLLSSSLDTTKNIIKFAIISIIVGLTTKWLYNLLSLRINTLLSLIILGAFASLSFILLTYAFGLYNLQLYIQKKKV